MKEFNVVPLSSGFMLTSLMGFIISVFFVYQKEGGLFLMEGGHYALSFKALGFILALFFIIMFAAAMISMTYAPVGYEKLIIDQKKRKK